MVSPLPHSLAQGTVFALKKRLWISILIKRKEAVTQLHNSAETILQIYSFKWKQYLIDQNSLVLSDAYCALCEMGI